MRKVVKMVRYNAMYRWGFVRGIWIGAIAGIAFACAVAAFAINYA